MITPDNVLRRAFGLSVAFVAAWPVHAMSDLHRRAVEQARRSEFAPAIATLARLHAGAPQDFHVLHDYVVVLAWAGQYGDALALRTRIDESSAPAYVLEALALASRSSGRAGDAESLYRGMLKRDPDHLEAQRGLASVLSQAGRGAEGEALLAQGPQTRERLLALAELAGQTGRPLVAIGWYDKLLAADPDDRAAVRGKVRMTTAIGAAQVAHERALAARHHFSLAELDELLADKTALDIRHAIASASVHPTAERFTGLDRALAVTTGLADRFDAMKELNAGERRLLFDRIVALTERFRMSEAIALFEQLRGRMGDAIPAYVNAAAASAYLYESQPARARALYEAVIASGSTEQSDRMGLFYAMLETEDYGRAKQHIDRIAADQPLKLHAEVPGIEQDNHVYISAQVAAANVRSWANRPADAEARLRALAGEAPNNTAVKAALGSVMWARSQPRLAAAELAEVAALEPDNAGIRAERVGPLIETHRFEEAEIELAQAVSRRPEDKRVQRAEQSWALHNSAQLVIDANTGNSRGNVPLGTRDRFLDAQLYAQPIAYVYRPFLHWHRSDARFESGTLQWDRLGAGVEYRADAIKLAAELNGNLSGGPNVQLGMALRGQWRPDDHWLLGGYADSQSNDVPLQARLAGYRGNRIALEADYRFHESRALFGGVSLLSFNDDNRRTSYSLGWEERLFATAHLKLDVRLGLYASQNTRLDAPYFNPRSDVSPTLALNLEWLTWRNYQWTFTQRLRGTAGTYSQRDYGTQPTYELFYEHVLDLGPRLNLRYGFGRRLHPYDGAQTGRNYFTLGLDGRF